MLSKSSKRKKPIRGLGEKPMVVALAKEPRRDAARAKETYERVYGGQDRVDWMKSLVCIVHELSDGECSGEIHCHHTRNGGMSMKADAKWCVPLCEIHHSQIHGVNGGTKSFETRFEIDLRASALLYDARYAAEHSAEHDNDD